MCALWPVAWPRRQRHWWHELCTSALPGLTTTSRHFVAPSLLSIWCSIQATSARPHADLLPDLFLLVVRSGKDSELPA